MGKEDGCNSEVRRSRSNYFADPDVLWFKTPFDEEIRKSDFKLKISIDNSHNYDEVLSEEIEFKLS